MYPTYAYTEPNKFKLHQDDINGIQSIYGKVILKKNKCSWMNVLKKVFSLYLYNFSAKEYFKKHGAQPFGPSPIHFSEVYTEAMA